MCNDTNEGERASQAGPRHDSRVRSERVMRGWDYAVFALLASLNLAALIYFAYHWFAAPGWWRQPVLFAYATILIAVVIVNYHGRWLMLLLMRRPVAPERTWNPMVGVATTFVPGAESIEMLERTVRALVAIEYPHETWVLDEGNDPRVRAMCGRLGARHFSRKGIAKYQSDDPRFRPNTKHGNVNAWLFDYAFDNFDVVSLFDPDHVPAPHFLDRVLDYFADEQIAYVQAAQAYYNQSASFVARAAAEETYAYNSSIQMAAYAMGYPVIVGSHNTHRVTALRDIGGLQPHDADDILTTLVYQARSWRGVFVPEILARGLAPVDWASYLTQQRRWARSVLDIKLRLHPAMSASLSLPTRVMSFLHGLNYLYRSFALFGSLVILLYTLATSIGSSVFDHLLAGPIGVLAGVMLACDFYRQRFYLDWRRECGLHWRVAFLHFAKWPHKLLALLDVLRRRRIPYEITPKARVASRRLRVFEPHAVAVVAVCLAWAVGGVLHLHVSPLARELAGVFVVCTLAIILSDLAPTPEPFDAVLASDASPTRRRGAARLAE